MNADEQRARGASTRKRQQPPETTRPENPDPTDPLAQNETARAIQRSIAVLARRAKDPALHELLGSRVGFPLGGPYYGTVARVGRAGEATVSELAQFLGLEISTVSRRVKFLEDHGMLKRRTDDRDRRSFRVRLTPKGRKVHAALDRGWINMITELTDGWQPDEIAAFASQLERFTTALEQLALQRNPSGPPSWLSTPTSASEPHDPGEI